MEQNRVKRHHRKRLIKKIISYILSFILSLCITALLFLLGIKAGVFNSSVITGQLNKTNYYAELSDTLYENIADALMPTGLPEEVLDGVIDGDRMYIDAKNSIEAAFLGKEYTADTSYLEDAFRANIESYIVEDNVEATDETEEGVQTLVDEITEEYNSLIEFPFVEYFIKYQAAYNDIFAYGVIIMLVLILIICAALIAMQHWAHRGVRYISYGVLAAAVMTGAAPLYIKLSGAYKSLNISPRYLYNLLVAIIEQDIDVFLYLAAGAIVIFGMCMGIIHMLKKRAQE